MERACYSELSSSELDFGDFSASSGTNPPAVPAEMPAVGRHEPHVPHEPAPDLGSDRQVRTPRRTRCAAAAASTITTTINCQSIPGMESLIRSQPQSIPI
jgi:hypothetical protein